LIYAREILVVLGCYALGCVCAGYYVVRWRRGVDIRTQASGSVGARNVGRILGTGWFLATLACDVAKGAAAVVLAKSLHPEPRVAVAAMLAVLAGHLWPVQLGFRGGKGVATSLGALLVLDYQLLICVFLVFGIVYFLVRQFTLSGLFAYAMLPHAAFVLDRSPVVILGMAALAVLVVAAHRSNLRSAVRASRESRGDGERERSAAKGIPE